MHYVETQAYRALINELGHDIDSLTQEWDRIDDASHYAARTPERSKRLKSLKGKINTRWRKLERLERLDMSEWNLFSILLEASPNGKLWTVEEALHWGKQLACNEGKGETAVRAEFNDTSGPTSQTGDVRANGCLFEVKNVQGKQVSGKPTIQQIQTSIVGRNAYLRWMGQRAEERWFVGLGDDLRDSIHTGSIAPTCLRFRLPPFVQQDLQTVLSPTNVFNDFEGVFLTTSQGRLLIPRVDYDRAWKLYIITKAEPQYRIAKEYMLDELRHLAREDNVFEDAAE